MLAEINPSSGSAVNDKGETVHGAGHGTTEGRWDGGMYEPTCTWRSNILPLAQTGRWRSRHGARWASCRTRPAASGAAGSGGWWRRSPTGSRSESGTASDPTPASSGTHRLVPETTTQTREMGLEKNYDLCVLSLDWRHSAKHIMQIFLSVDSREPLWTKDEDEIFV